LGVRGSTLSAALKRLEKLGYLRRERMLQDLRTMALALTPHGAKAMAETSVLDSERVAALLARLSRREKNRALEGLELLARAARQVMEKAASRRS
jgi:DNA-binding MarR family transcriptional regulator